MDKEKNELSSIEYQLAYQSLCKELGKEKVDAILEVLNEALDIEMIERFNEQFDNLADISDIHKIND